MLHPWTFFPHFFHPLSPAPPPPPPSSSRIPHPPFALSLICVCLSFSVFLSLPPSLPCSLFFLIFSYPYTRFTNMNVAVIYGIWFLIVVVCGSRNDWLAMSVLITVGHILFLHFCFELEISVCVTSVFFFKVLCNHVAQGQWDYEFEQMLCAWNHKGFFRDVNSLRGRTVL